MKTVQLMLAATAAFGLTFVSPTPVRADSTRLTVRMVAPVRVHEFTILRAPAAVHRPFYFNRSAWPRRHFFRPRFRRFHGHFHRFRSHSWGGRAFHNRTFRHRGGFGRMRSHRRW